MPLSRGREAPRLPASTKTITSTTKRGTAISKAAATRNRTRMTSLRRPMSRVAARGSKTGHGEQMLVQLHGQEARPDAASEQSARDGCSVSLQETSAREGRAAFTDVKRRVNRSGVVMRCGRPRDRWHANYRSEPLREPGVLFALNAKLTTNTVSDTTTSNAAVETAAAIRASACSTHASFEEPRRLCVPSCSGARRAHRSLAQEAGRKRCTLPAGGVNERRCGGGNAIVHGQQRCGR